MILVRFRRDPSGPWSAVIRVPTDDIGAVMAVAERHFVDLPPRNLGGPKLAIAERR